MILCIVHSSKYGMGRFPGLLSELNLAYETVCIVQGQMPSRELEEYAGVIVFGGKFSAHEIDTVQGLLAEYKMIESLISMNKPIIGICLGGQIMSTIFGAPSPLESDSVEIGFFEIQPTDKGRSFFESNDMFFQWHRDPMPLPTEAHLLGSTEHFTSQAYFLKNSLALQFHPDATLRVIREWIDIGAESFREFGAQSRSQIIELAAHQEAFINSWTKGLLIRWFI